MGIECDTSILARKNQYMYEMLPYVSIRITRSPEAKTSNLERKKKERCDHLMITSPLEEERRSRSPWSSGGPAELVERCRVRIAQGTLDMALLAGAAFVRSS